MTGQRRRPSDQDDHPTDVFTREDYYADGQDVADEWEQALRGDDEPVPAGPRREQPGRGLNRERPAGRADDRVDDRGGAYADDQGPGSAGPGGPADAGADIDPDTPGDYGDGFANDFSSAAQPTAAARGRADVEDRADPDDEDRPTQVFAAVREESDPRGGGSIYSAARYPARPEAAASTGLFEDFRPADDRREDPGGDDEDRYETAVIPKITDEPEAEPPAAADPEETAEWTMRPEDLEDPDELGGTDAAESVDDPDAPGAAAVSRASDPDPDPAIEDASTVLIPRLSREDGEPELLSGNRSDAVATGAGPAATGLAAAGVAAGAGAAAAGAATAATGSDTGSGADQKADRKPDEKADKKAAREARKAERAARRAAKSGEPSAPAAAPVPEPTAQSRAADGEPGTTGPRARRPILLVAVLALLTVLGAAGAYYNHEQTREALRYKPSSNLAFVDAAATAQAREQVSRAVEAIYSYDAANLDQSEQRALSFIEGGYIEEFKRNFAMVRQLGPRQKASLTSTVAEAGLENLTERRATLLVMVNQKGRRADTPQELKATVRLSVTAERVGGQWKVTGIEQR